MRVGVFVSIIGSLAVLLATVLLAPYIGLGQDYNFILYRYIGVSRGEAFFWLRFVLVLFCIAQLLLPNRELLCSKQHWITVARSARLVVQQTIGALFDKRLIEKDPPAVKQQEWGHVALVCAFFLATLSLFLSRNLVALSEQNDLEWYQAFIDFDIDWRTPRLSLAGNLLNNFGVQVPVNANLAPLISLAHAVSSRFQIVTALALFYLAIAALFWAVGRIIGLRPVPCGVLAGVAALILNIPFGLESVQVTLGVAAIGAFFWILGAVLGLRPTSRVMLVALLTLIFAGALGQMYLLPDSTFTTMLTLIFWWQEAVILSLISVVLFFLLGQKQSGFTNLALGSGFGLLCYLTLLAFPAVAIFATPVIGLYCLCFLATANNKKEFFWKIVVGGIVAVAMLATRIPAFFLNLFGHSWGYYFVKLVSRYDRVTSLKFTSMITAWGNTRLNIAMLLSLAMLCFLIWRAKGTLRRIAFSVLFVQLCIFFAGIVNAFTLNLPIAVSYLEFFHLPFLVFFCVLFLLAVVTVLVMGFRISNATYGKSIPTSRLSPIAATMLWIISVLAIAGYGLFDRAPAGPLKYPPTQPPSVQILRNELEIKPGQSFRGRALVLAGMLGPPGKQWPDGGPGSVLDVLEFHYRPILGNDHYVHLLPFGIPVANEMGHWTSPLTFIFLHEFFGRKDDIVADKAIFPLRAFNERIARLVGIRMIVTDAPTLPGASLVYETKAGDADLRIFRIENINLGQYSPTQTRRVSTAVEAITNLRSMSFDPLDDVVVESEINRDLVPATNASVITNLGPTLWITAESAGWSLLVLPFEYSHCLHVDAQDGTTASLIAVNLQQTGLLFEKKIKANLSYRFGPLDHPECRKADLERADRIRLREAL
jgi:hypothetical protein